MRGRAPDHAPFSKTAFCVPKRSTAFGGFSAAWVLRPARIAGLFVVRDRRISASRSEENTSELQSLMRISYAVFCLQKKTYKTIHCVTTSSFINISITHLTEFHL